MPNSIKNPLFPGQYEVSGGDVVFIDAPAGALGFQVMFPNGNIRPAKVWLPGLRPLGDATVLTTGGIYFEKQPSSSVTKVVFSPIDYPLAWGGVSGMHTILVNYELPYLAPSWRFDVHRPVGDGE